MGNLLYVRGCEKYAPTVNAICKSAKIHHTDLARGLIEAACNFYETEHWFAFPAEVFPIMFRRETDQGSNTLPLPLPLTGEAPRMPHPATIPDTIARDFADMQRAAKDRATKKP